MATQAKQVDIVEIMDATDPVTGRGKHKVLGGMEKIICKVGISCGFESMP